MYAIKIEQSYKQKQNTNNDRKAVGTTYAVHGYTKYKIVKNIFVRIRDLIQSGV